jgi:hypothetical protein
MSEAASRTPKAASKTVSLTVELPRDLVERLNALADRTTWDVADYVREALAGYIPLAGAGDRGDPGSHRRSRCRWPHLLE